MLIFLCNFELSNEKNVLIVSLFNGVYGHLIKWDAISHNDDINYEVTNTTLFHLII